MMEEHTASSFDVPVAAAVLAHLPLVPELGLTPVLPAMEEPATADLLLLQLAAAGTP